MDKSVLDSIEARHQEEESTLHKYKQFLADSPVEITLAIRALMAQQYLIGYSDGCVYSINKMTDINKEEEWVIVILPVNKKLIETFKRHHEDEKYYDKIFRDSNYSIDRSLDMRVITGNSYCRGFHEGEQVGAADVLLEIKEMLDNDEIDKLKKTFEIIFKNYEE